MQTSSSSAPPASVSVLFARGVLARLRTWQALTLAIAEGWGGPEGAAKLPWLAGAVVDAFEDPPADGTPDAEYVEALLLQVMEDEFECTLEDGSAWDVARDVVRVWDAIARGGDAARTLVEELEARAERVKGKAVAAHRGEDEDDSTDEDGDDMDVDDGEEAPQLLVVEHTPAPKPDPIVDEDGFTLVQVKGKGKP
jgi:pre-rRNA-processing protein TSR2